MTENARDGSRRTRSQAAPEWTVTELLILVNEIAAVEADWSVQLSSYQQWDIISENCAALDVDRNLAQCRRKWQSLLAEYEDFRKRQKASSSLDPELFGAIERVVKGREERGEIDRESDLDASVEIETGSKRKRQRRKSEKHLVHKRKESHDEEPGNNHLEEEYLKDFLGKKSKLKRTAKRQPKLIESLPLKNLTELDESHNIEMPKPEESVGNITNNRREENEEILTLKLRELAIEIQEISAESADCKEANPENIEDYRTEFTRRQGDKLIARLGNFSNTLKQLCDLLQECK
ncbi:uncharacterized protein LOC127092255 [Lathyrus oleraceus]|uniref:Myb-like domain-containing protein n=1 Tax=Pisum sativum TaxID=3888 RepID=A0A9D5A3M2_PEA|nr:uncharacterized protein LOC127092255 [Pisum sativum]KAI5394011.1 hypothetical protein KIW84_060924 [Pisum sativum]